MFVFKFTGSYLDVCKITLGLSTWNICMMKQNSRQQISSVCPSQFVISQFPSNPVSERQKTKPNNFCERVVSICTAIKTTHCLFYPLWNVSCTANLGNVKDIESWILWFFLFGIFYKILFYSSFSLQSQPRQLIYFLDLFISFSTVVYLK